MALTVNFWSFTKKVNSTAIPAASPARTFSCSLKSDCSLLAPSIELGVGLPFNPAGLNYAQIPDFNRYYWVGDWQWTGGLWTAPLTVDPLASFKTDIGAANKYILRASYESDDKIVDSFYPAQENVNVSWASHSFSWASGNFGGTFILGVINGEGHALAGSTEYYILTKPELQDFMEYLFPESAVAWGSLSQMEESIYKSIYDPLQFIVSCKYFPFGIGGQLTDTNIWFGQFKSSKFAEPLDIPQNWPVFSYDYTIPSAWLSRPARERSSPYADLFFWMQPWGVIQLSTSDFTLTDTVRVRITPDLISGEGLIQIYALINNNEMLVAQQTGMLGYDINLTAINRDMFAATSSLISGAARAAGEIAAGLPPVSSLISAGDAYANLARPSIYMSSRGSPSIRNLDGTSRLYLRRHTFPEENNSEYGRPLYKNKQISAIPGYIKAGDSDFQVAGAMKEELDMIGEFFTGGFFYE